MARRYRWCAAPSHSEWLTSPTCSAQEAACTRSVTSSFRSTLDTWTLTVFGLMKLGPDLGVGQTRADQAQHLLLLCGQVDREPRCDRRRWTRGAECDVS